MLRLALLWASNYLGNMAGISFGGLIYLSYLNKPYDFHIQITSSEVLNTVIDKSNLAIGCIVSAANLISGLILSIAIVITLLYVDTASTIFCLKKLTERDRFWF
jgi:hypothetical protein